MQTRVCNDITSNSSGRQSNERRCSRGHDKLYNATNVWSEEWVTLASITLTTPIHSTVISKTRLHLRIHPMCVSLPRTPRVQAYASLAHIMAPIYDTEKSAKTVEDISDSNTYHVTVHTGSASAAGTDADVYITITGKIQSL